MDCGDAPGKHLLMLVFLLMGAERLRKGKRQQNEEIRVGKFGGVYAGKGKRDQGNEFAWCCAYA